MVSEHGVASSTEGTADIKEFVTSAVGDASESKFHSEGSAGSLANVLSGKKRRTKPKSGQAPSDEVVEPRVESRAGETNSCDVSRHVMVPLVLESGGQVAEIPVPGEMTSKGVSDFPAVSGVEESLQFSTDFRDAKKIARITECEATPSVTSKLSAHQMPPVGEASAVPTVSSSDASSRVDTPAFLLLYWTLVDENLVPELGAFGELWEAAAEREADRKSTWGNVRAAVELHSERNLQQKLEDRARHTQDQFLLAAIERPTRFRTRLQKVQYEGATARKDAEEETRSRWMHVLCSLEHEHADGTDGKRQTSQHSVAGRDFASPHQSHS